MRTQRIRVARDAAEDEEIKNATARGEFLEAATVEAE